jgi:hypothetical protein
MSKRVKGGMENSETALVVPPFRLSFLGIED